MKTLSIHRPLPSIEIRTPARLSTSVNSWLVNWLPWSVLKIFGLPYLASLLQGFRTEITVQCVRQAPGERRTRRPVHDHHQVLETTTHRDIGDVGTPNVVRLIDPQVS